MGIGRLWLARRTRQPPERPTGTSLVSPAFGTFPLPGSSGTGREPNPVKNAPRAADRYSGRFRSVEPSVKGSLFVTGVVAIRRYRDSGYVSEDQITARLGPVALEMLDQKIDISRWYPIDAFCEMLDMDWEIAAERSPTYMRRPGWKSDAATPAICPPSPASRTS
jgi:hypothetical protein